MISGCAEGDGDLTAQITDATKSWVNDEWAGGVLQITSGEGRYRRFDIISNTSDTLTVQQNEVAGNVDSEYTICGSHHYSNPFPVYEYDLGEIQPGDSYEIGLGYYIARETLAKFIFQKNITDRIDLQDDYIAIQLSAGF